MNISALLTSAGINIGIICLLLLSFYSILRKQPGNAYVYFGRQLAEECKRARDSFILESFVPSPSYIVEALQYTEEEILSIAGLDAVVFNGIMVFRKRFSPVFQSYSAWDFNEMDDADERAGKMEEIHQKLASAYCQFPPGCQSISVSDGEGKDHSKLGSKSFPKDSRKVYSHPALVELPVSRLWQAISTLSMLMTVQNKS